MFRLALAVGEWDVDSLARRMPCGLLAEWLAFYRLEPFGDDWRRTGRAATWQAAMAGVKLAAGFEDRFLPGGGKYRGMSAEEAHIHDQLAEIEASQCQQ